MSLETELSHWIARAKAMPRRAALVAAAALGCVIVLGGSLALAQFKDKDAAPVTAPAEQPAPTPVEQPVDDTPPAQMPEGVEPPPLEAKGLFIGTDIESTSSSLALAPDGSLHAAYAGYDGASKDKIYYALCTKAACTTLSDWKTVELPLEGSREVQIEVTPSGQPRMLAISWSSANANGSEYHYLECDKNCTSPKNWRSAQIADSADGIMSNIGRDRMPERTFALTDKGQPRFIYTDENYSVEPDHYGAFYMSCDTACTKPSNWTETDIANHHPAGYATESLNTPVLALGRGGQARVISNVYAFDTDGSEMKAGLYYYGCEDDCADRDNWQRAYVIDVGGGSFPNPTWDMDLTADGSPRLALFAGYGMTDDALSNQLIYLWCDDGCFDEANWWGNVVGPGDGIGESPDIELDDRGYPRIAFTTPGGDIGLARCEIDCQTTVPAWWSDFAERTSAPQEQRPQYLPFHCDGELWQGYAPDLLVSGKRIIIGYDIAVEARCLYKDYEDPIPSATFHQIFRGARMFETTLTY